MSVNVQNILQRTIGQWTDTINSKTLFGKLCRIQQNTHNSIKAYPTLSNGITVIAHTTPWTLGNFVELIPSNVISKTYHIDNILIENASDESIYEMYLYKGTVGNEEIIGNVRFGKSNKKGQGTSFIPFQSSHQEPNERISCKLASKEGNHEVELSLHYVELDVDTGF